jgi:EmrB/QacA subfamily drug resistance transporter
MRYRTVRATIHQVAQDLAPMNDDAARPAASRHNEADGVALGSSAGRWLVAVAVLGSGIVFLDGTVVNVALPDIGRDLGASTSSLQWILNGYALTLAALILLGGSLGDRYGRRRVFVSGVIVFTGASALCTVAPNVPILVLARLVEGIGGALLTPGSLAIIESGLQPDDRARAIGTWSGLTGVAGAVGPLVGGYLVAAVSWRAIFLINLPLGVFVAVTAGRHVAESHDPTAGGSLDVAGAALAALGLGGTTYALIEAPRGGGAATIWLIGACGVLALVGFFARERRVANPMLPLGMFRSRQFSAANLVTFVVYAALGGVFFLLVSCLQVSLRYSPIAAGAASLPVTILMLLLSSRSGALAQRIGPRIPLTVGPLIIAAGMLLMTRIGRGSSYVASVLPAVMVFGLGLTLVVAPVTAAVLAAADERHSGIASGINNAVSRVAGLLAVAVLPVVAGLTGRNFYVPAKMVTGFHTAMLASAGLAATGGIIAWLTIRSDAAPDASGVGRCAQHPTAFSRDVAGNPLRPLAARQQPRIWQAGTGPRGFWRRWSRR